MKDHQSLRDLLGPMAALKDIPPPDASFAGWEIFLERCREAGIAAIDERTQQFATPLGYALLKRWRWLQDARRRGLSYDDAEDAFSAMIEREGDATAASLRDQDRRRQSAMSERDGKGKKRPTAAEVFDREHSA